jgi:hypothetical protein
MGNGRWAPDTYHNNAAARQKAGVDTFAYSNRAVQSGDLRVHPSLDPRGMTTRQSRDSEEHPASNAIVISLDVTGSMGTVVRGIHANLPQLHELLLGHKYISDPQICFAGVGDATCDRVPLQIGQFESDNRMDQNLEHMILEGGGGGQNTESYELILYVAARLTATDCLEKRGRKGYLFIIGDEWAYPAVSAAQIGGLIGGGGGEDIPLDRIVAEAREKFHVYFVIPGGASHGRDPRLLEFWTNLLGVDRVILVQSPEQTSECIALAIGINEGAVDLPTAVGQMQGRGLVAKTIDGISQALRTMVGSDTGPGSRRL